MSITLEEIRKQAPKDAESYRVKNSKVFYYRYDKKPSGWILQRWDGCFWYNTIIFDTSEIKPL